MQTKNFWNQILIESVWRWLGKRCDLTDRTQCARTILYWCFNSFWDSIAFVSLSCINAQQLVASNLKTGQGFPLSSICNKSDVNTVKFIYFFACKPFLNILAQVPNIRKQDVCMKSISLIFCCTNFATNNFGFRFFSIFFFKPFAQKC